MEEKYNVLKKFGLTENEIKVYLECLKEKELSPYQISKLTHIPRTTVYDVLMSLSLKGLVELEQSTGLEKQQTKVHSKNPSILRTILKNRRDESYKTEVEIAEILPELKGFFHGEESNANFKFYPGIEGMKKVYATIETDDSPLEQYTWSHLMPLDVFGSDDINEDVQKGTLLRKKKNYSAKELVPLNTWTKHVISYQYQLDNDYIEHREFRGIEGEFFEINLDFMIKGDFIKIACAHEDEVWGLKIKSHALASTLKSIYMITWNIAKPITKELIESWGENQFLKAQKEIKKM